jgi:anti-anti-sigma factor
MKMSDDQRGDVLIVRPEGRIDTTTSEELERWVAARLDGGTRRLVVDMSAVDYISSAGLRVFLMNVKKLRGNGGQFVLAGLNTSVRQIFELAGFLSIFAVETDVDRAVARAAGVAPGA